MMRGFVGEEIRVEFGVVQDGTTQIDPTQIGSSHIRTAEIGSAKCGVAQVRPGEACFLQIRMPTVRTSQVCTS